MKEKPKYPTPQI